MRPPGTDLGKDRLGRTAYLGLGSNLGDRESELRRAIAHLARCLTVTSVSPIYETEPVGFTSQPAFLNLALAASTDLEPPELLACLLRLERRLGRRRDPALRFGPRTIDIDILLVDDLIVDLPEIPLRVPHARLHERAFALVPLADIAPDLVHPCLGLTIAALAAAVGSRGVRPWP